MKFFKKLAANVGMALASAKAIKQIQAAAELGSDAKEAKDWGPVAVAFAKAAESMQGLIDKSAKAAELNGISGGEIETLVRGGEICAQGMRAMASYSAEVDSGSDVGGLTRLLGLDVERRWLAGREEAMAAIGERGSPMLAKLGWSLGAMGLLCVTCSIRAEAARLKGEGLLDEAKTEELAERVRTIIGDVEAISRFANALRKKADPSDAKAVAEERAKQAADRLKEAGAKANKQSEEAQIYWIGGMEKQARECIAIALACPTQQERDAAREGLAKEVCRERGNDKGFCEWARKEFSLAEPEAKIAAKAKM